MKLISTDVLPNGFRFYSQYDPSAHLCGIGIKCGSIHDPRLKRGTAHLAEHVRCRETERFTGEDVDLIMERFMHGPDGDINVRVSWANTFFGNDSLVRRRHMLLCWDMWVDLIRHGIIDEEGLDVEKAAIYQEYFLYGKDRVEEVVLSELLKIIYQTNPVRNDIACEPEELRIVTIGQLRQFIRRYYGRPKNLFAVILGPTHNEVREMAKRAFGDMKDDGKPELDIDMSERYPTLDSVKSVETSMAGIHQTHVGLGFPTDIFGKPDSEILDIISRTLAYRMRRRLRDGNRYFERGVYRVLPFTYRTFINGILYIWFASTDPEIIKCGEQAFVEECNDLRKNLISDREWVSFTDSLLFQYLDAFEKTPGTLSELIIEAASNNDEELRFLHSTRERLHKITRRKIRAVAQKVLTIPNYARVVVRPA